MWYVLGIIGVLAISAAAVGAVLKWSRPIYTNTSTTYFIRVEDTVFIPDVESPQVPRKRNSGRKMGTYRPKIHAKQAAREAETLTDDNLREALADWSRSLDL